MTPSKATSDTHVTTDADALPRFSVDDAEEYPEFYRSHGYVIFEDMFSPTTLHGVREAILDHFAGHLDIDRKARPDADILLDHYEDDRPRWRAAAHRTTDLLPVHALYGTPALLQVLNALGLQRPILSTIPEVRTDMPEDRRYMQPWHQDWRYGQGSVDSVTIWTPLHEVRVIDGTIDVRPGTHLLGALETEERPDPRRFEIVDPRADDQAHFPIELGFGECVLFSQLLVHRSGVNVSGRPRLTVQLRFTNCAEKNFRAHGLPRPLDSTLLWDTPPTADDAAEVFRPPVARHGGAPDEGAARPMGNGDDPPPGGGR